MVLPRHGPSLTLAGLVSPPAFLVCTTQAEPGHLTPDGFRERPRGGTDGLGAVGRRARRGLAVSLNSCASFCQMEMVITPLRVGRKTQWDCKCSKDQLVAVTALVTGTGQSGGPWL